MTDPFWAYFGRTLIKPVVIAGLVIIILVEAYVLFLRPTEDSLASARQDLAERACTQVAADLPKRSGASTIAVLNIAGDANGTVTGLLRQRLQKSGDYRMLDGSFLVKLLREFGKENAPVSRLADAVSTAREIGVDLVVFGEVADFTVDDSTSRLKLEMRMADRQSGQAVFARSYSFGTPEGASSWRTRLANSPKSRRIFMWVVFTLLLPVLCIPLIRRWTARDSNLVNLALLLGLTIVDMFVALFLTGFGISTAWTIVVLFLALGGSCYYNYRITSFIQDGVTAAAFLRWRQRNKAMSLFKSTLAIRNF